VTTPRGFFQFAGLQAGEYTLTAEGAPGRVAKLDLLVAKDQEILVSDLILHDPSALELSLEPPVAPDGNKWRVQLVTSDPNPAVIVRDEEVSSDGTWKKTGIPVGAYRLNVKAGRDRWHSHLIELQSGNNHFSLRSSSLRLRGTITLGGQPLRASLRFGSGRETRVSIESEDDGTFEILLPERADGMEPDEWEVDIEALSVGVRRTVPRVRITRTSPTEAEVTINLPATHVEGAVVNEDGAPVEGSLIRIQPLRTIEPPVSAVSGASGMFAIHGLPAGHALVGAEGPQGSADDIEIDVLEGQTARVKLVLRRTVEIRGQVTCEEGPVWGAQVKMFPPDQPLRPILTLATDEEGRFVAELPSSHPQVSVNVAAVGCALHMGRLEARADTVLRVPLSRASGTLVLATPLKSLTPEWDLPSILVFHNGSYESLQSLINWAAANGVRQKEQDVGRVVIPNLEPGEYVACQAPMSQLLALSASTAGYRQCTRGVLNPGTELKLSVD
jgi:hypothetical protein